MSVLPELREITKQMRIQFEENTLRETKEERISRILLDNERIIKIS
jgi:hypothetical protein